jgi:glycosyltransferase involved in cell wall biosynthesis
LVGDGPDEVAVREMCRKLDLRNVGFTGFKHADDLPRFYGASDVFVFPTLGDPYGLVIDEAMASRLPVISTDAAGEVHERIIEGENGMIVPARDSVALAKAMEVLAVDKGLREQMGRVSFSMVSERKPENWAQDLERCVEIVLGRPAAWQAAKVENTAGRKRARVAHMEPPRH